MSELIVVNFEERKVVATYEGLAAKNPEALGVLATQLLKGVRGGDLDALDGELVQYDERLSEENQGSRFFYGGAD